MWQLPDIPTHLMLCPLWPAFQPVAQRLATDDRVKIQTLGKLSHCLNVNMNIVLCFTGHQSLGQSNDAVRHHHHRSLFHHTTVLSTPGWPTPTPGWPTPTPQQVSTWPPCTNICSNKRLNPRGKLELVVESLVPGGFIMWKTAAIGVYLGLRSGRGWSGAR